MHIQILYGLKKPKNESSCKAKVSEKQCRSKLLHPLHREHAFVDTKTYVEDDMIFKIGQELCFISNLNNH